MNTKTLFKNLFFLPILGIFLSCSGDDDSGKPPVESETQLVLTASTTETTIGEEITFEVTANGEVVSDATILVDGAAISGYSHVFDTAGTYEVVAQKEGYTDSQPLNLEVNEVQIDVYAAGYKQNMGGEFVAKYWKNGMSFNLTNGANYAHARSIFVDKQGNVHVVGFEEIGSIYIAKYWKNGASTNLSDGTSNANAESVFVYEGDVYVAGYEGSKAVYWKNGGRVDLTDGANYSSAYSIFVYKGDVYVAGYESNGSKNVAVYWKNGNKILLTDGSHNAKAHSIFVHDGDVYVAGYDSNVSGNGVAVYWKNDNPTNLTDGSNNANSKSIFVYEDKVYVSGEEKGMAKYWSLPANNPGTVTPVSLSGVSAYSVFVMDEDVYVGGVGEDSGNYIARYWKNGQAVDFPENSPDAGIRSIFVTKTIVE